MSPDSHSLYLIPATVKDGKESRKQWKGMPPADSERGERECVISLQSPSPEPGCWRITCDRCPAWALVSVKASVDDPKTFALPCGRIEV